MKKLAIVGSGISGLACLFFLHQHYDITLFEQNSTLGGHTNTIQIHEEGNFLSVDTGFMVFNKVTYPNLLRFFQALNIAYQATDMSFSVNHIPENIQWNGAGLRKLFSQRQNLFKPRFYRLLLAMQQFCKDAPRDMENPLYRSCTIQDYASLKGYPQDFLTLFLIPMSSAIWSTGLTNIMGFPVQTLIRFFLNHGFLGLDTHFQWYTVTGGSKTYIDALLKRVNVTIALEHQVKQVLQNDTGVTLTFENQPQQQFDTVILASHANQSLAMLDEPSELETRLLQPFQYERNLASIHTDTSVMPSIQRTWAAWNYRVNQTEEQQPLHTSTHYWMNRLQNIPSRQNYFVSLNSEDIIHPDKLIRTIDYEHPVFSLDAIQAQQHLSTINQQHNSQRLFFCGSYFRYGFHEDAFTSALQLCRQLTGEPIWL